MLRKILIIIAVPFLLIACNGGEKSQEMPPPIVIVETVETKEVKSSENFIGKIDAVNKASITVRVSGFLEKILVKEGDYVKKDQLLFTIEKSSYEASVRSAEASLAQANANAHNTALQRERSKALVDSASISRATYDNVVAADEVAKANVAAAKAGLANARLNLEYTDVVAPIDGKVGLITANIGETVSPSSGVVTTVIAPNPMYVIFTMTDRQYQQLRRDYNQTNGSSDLFKLVDLQLVLSDGREYAHMGTLNFVDNAVGSGTDSIRMRGVFDNPEGLLVQGQTVTVKVLSKKTENTVVIPQRAVVNDIGGKYVIVIKEGEMKEDKPTYIASRRTVEVGAILPDAMQVVISGLSAGEMIIVDGVQKVTMNAPVVPMTQEQVDAMSKQQAQPGQPGEGEK